MDRERNTTKKEEVARTRGKVEERTLRTIRKSGMALFLSIMKLGGWRARTTEVSGGEAGKREKNQIRAY